MASEYPREISVGAKRARLLFLALFLCFLTAPAVQQYLGIFAYAPVVENRMKAPKPYGILGIFDSESGFAQKYESYFNDSYGLRDFFIKLKNQLDMWLFRTSDEVLIGEDGWLFYRKLYERDMRTLESSAHLIPTVVARLALLNTMLQKQGIKLVIVPCPAKTTLYRDLVPSSYPVAPKDTAFQQYRRLLSKHPEISVVDVQGILEQLKPRMRVFHKTDFHWTDPAGAVVWKELYTALGGFSQQILPPLPRVLVAKRHRATGGEVNYLAVFFPPTETALNLRRPLAAPQGSFEASPKQANVWTYVASDKTDLSLLPPTILVGDSFSDAFLRAGFTAAFKEISKVPSDQFAQIALNPPPGTRFLILEHIESALLAMTLDSWWPQALLSASIQLQSQPTEPAP